MSEVGFIGVLTTYDCLIHVLITSAPLFHYIVSLIISLLGKHIYL